MQFFSVGVTPNAFATDYDEDGRGFPAVHEVIMAHTHEEAVNVFLREFKSELELAFDKTGSTSERVVVGVLIPTSAPAIVHLGHIRKIYINRDTLKELP